MFKRRVLVLSFFLLLLFSISFYNVLRVLSSIAMLASACILAIGLFLFVRESKRKKVGRIKIEEVAFVRNFVFRTYFKPKDLWVVYDKKERRFRPADFRDTPLKVGLTLIVGVLALYISYMILQNLFQFPELLWIRVPFLIIVLVIGLYDFFVSCARIASLANKKSRDVSRALNKSKSLKNFIRREKAFVEVTPNFTLDGFVTSVEIVTHRKYNTKKIEKLLLQISRSIMKK